MQTLLMPLVFVGFAFFRADRPEGTPAFIGLALSGYALFASWGAGQNMLGYEGTGLQTLLLTPVPRDRVLLGKSLGLALLVMVPTLVLGLGVVAIAPTWISVAGLLLALAVPPIAMGIGAIVSVRYPWAIDLERTQRTNVFSTRGGCATGIANILVVPLVTGLLTMPPLAVVSIAVLLDRPLMGLAVGGAALAYSWWVLWMGTRFAGGELLRREPEVVAATRIAD